MLLLFRVRVNGFSPNNVILKSRLADLNRRDATRAHKDEITSRIKKTKNVATKLRRTVFLFLKTSHRVVAADNPAGWSRLISKLKLSEQLSRVVWFFFFFYLFFCGELDSSASGSHDGFIRGLQPLSCFSL